MRFVRWLSLATILVLGFAGPARAERVTAPGTYPVKVAVAPALLPPGSLPASVPSLGPDVYDGSLQVERADNGSYHVHLSALGSGARRLVANAQFSSGWTGFELGTVVIGGDLVPDALVSIDAAHLVRANIAGVGTVGGALRHVVVRVGAGGAILQFLVAPAAVH